MVFFPHSAGFFFSYPLCSSRALNQFFTLLSGVAEAGVSAPPGNKQNRRRLRLQQRERRHNRSTRRHQTIPPPITTNCSSTLPARLHPPTHIPHTPTQTKKSTPLARAGRTGRESRGQGRSGMGGGHSRSQRAEWPAHAHSERKTRRRTARERARVHLGTALRQSTRVRHGAADQERARVCGGWRRAARERAREEQGGAPRGSTRAGQCGVDAAAWRPRGRRGRRGVHAGPCQS